MHKRIVASSDAMKKVVAEIRRLAPFGELSVLIGGESGTGKELVARALHRGSPRSHRPFVTVNAASLPDTLLEAELFGYARGAFTGATDARTGLLEEADGGTLFLDEIADLPPRAQTSVLRVLQEREYRRLGENRVRRSDFRLVTATHKDLDAEVAAGRFRLDLYYRLKVARVVIPPLRERPDDILPLAVHALEDGARRLELDAPSLSSEAGECLRHYAWPGNVRELQNEMLQALVRSNEERELGPNHLSPHLRRGERVSFDLRAASAAHEKTVLEKTLALAGGNRTRAAKELGLSRQSLYRKMRRHGLAPPRNTLPLREISG